ncbi:hypothetical protein [Streptomyces sp. NPDC051219]|uniref:hypothetical protein n=1 Tax=Streptomyces sp. NPDC051219 TaxID=3155283 RepID=UPI0034497D3E
MESAESRRVSSPLLRACGTGTSRTAAGSGGKSSKTLVVRNSGGTYGEANQKAV